MNKLRLVFLILITISLSFCASTKTTPSKVKESKAIVPKAPAKPVAPPAVSVKTATLAPPPTTAAPAAPTPTTPVALATIDVPATPTPPAGTAPVGPSLQAKMESRSGSKVKGTIVLTQKNENQVELQIDLTGFAPNTPHAFHVHSYGDCSDEGAASAGPHFNPSGARHGGPDHEMRHAGDMGNLQADEKGEVHTQKINTLITLKENLLNSALGKSIIVHESVDDFTTQPTGNAGARVTCGVIQKK